MKPSTLHEAGVKALAQQLRNVPINAMVTHWPDAHPQTIEWSTIVEGSNGDDGRPQMAIAGKIPDLIVLDRQGRTAAVGEVGVTSPCTEEKATRYLNANIPLIAVSFQTWRDVAIFAASSPQQVIDLVQGQGFVRPLDLVGNPLPQKALVEQPDQWDALFPKVLTRSQAAPKEPNTRVKTLGQSSRFRHGDTANSVVQELIDAIRLCDPEYRMVLKELIDALDSDESHEPTLALVAGRPQ